MIVLAGKAFGFAPDYTLWEISWPLLSSMFSELNYLEFTGEEPEVKTDSLAGIPGIVIT